MKARKLGSKKSSKAKKKSSQLKKDRFKERRKKKSETENPFELKFNRSKHEVLGKSKQSISSSVGRPGASRQKAMSAREKTLAVEYRQFGKTNKIIDRRLGERDPHLNAEERASQRFTAQRLNLLSKGKRFRLEDDEDQLTHRGHSLIAIEKYDQTVQSDEEDGGEIGADIVTAAHFGGGEAQKTFRDGLPRNRKEMMADLIARTRMEREAKAMKRDEFMDATEKLDVRLKELMAGGVLSSSFNEPKSKERMPTDRSSGDTYDLLLSNLRQSTAESGRVSAGERVKTAEEIAQDEANKLAELERKRLQSIAAQEPSSKHQSADEDTKRARKRDDRNDDDDGFEVRYGPDGRLLNAEKVKPPKIKVVRICNESSDEDLDEVESEQEEESDDQEDLEGMEDAAEEDETGQLNGHGCSEENGMKSGGDDDIGDGFYAQSSDDDDAGDEQQTGDVQPSKSAAPRHIPNSEIPFVFSMPTSFAQFKQLFTAYPSHTQSIVMGRLIKCHHPSLIEGNQHRLNRLFLFTLRYYDELAREEPGADVGGHIQAIGLLYKSSEEYANRCMRVLLKSLRAKQEKNRRDMPNYSALAYLHLVNQLYADSAARHSICSPAMQMAIDMVKKVRIMNVKVLAQMLALIRTVLEFEMESKRYIPEVVAFLAGILFLAIENDDWERPAVGNIPHSMPYRRMLFIEENLEKMAQLPSLAATFAKTEQIPSGFDKNAPELRAGLLTETLSILAQYVTLYTTHGRTFVDLFQPVLRILRRLPIEKYPPELVDQTNSLIGLIQSEIEHRRSHGGKPKKLETTVKDILPLLEPRFEANFDPERPKRQSDAPRNSKKAERKKLEHKYKREMRGTMRELRKDNLFLARERRKDVSAKDADRIEKTKKLMRSLQGQEAEHNEMKRKKKKF